MALCALGQTTGSLPPPSALPPLDYPTRAISPREITFPAIPLMHHASALATGDAHVNCYYLTELGSVLERYGNHGYRLAQLECSLHAGKLHVATHALGLRAVGSTSFDDEVVGFFSPHAAGKSYMFVMVFWKRRPRGS